MYVDIWLYTPVARVYALLHSNRSIYIYIYINPNSLPYTLYRARCTKCVRALLHLGLLKPPHSLIAATSASFAMRANDLQKREVACVCSCVRCVFRVCSRAPSHTHTPNRIEDWALRRPVKSRGCNINFLCHSRRTLYILYTLCRVFAVVWFLHMRVSLVQEMHLAKVINVYTIYDGKQVYTDLFI